MTLERLSEIIEDCNQAVTCSNHPFTKWEVDFIHDVSDRFEEGQSLHPNTVEKLVQIWEKI